MQRRSYYVLQLPLTTSNESNNNEKKQRTQFYVKNPPTGRNSAVRPTNITVVTHLLPICGRNMSKGQSKRYYHVSLRPLHRPFVAWNKLLRGVSSILIRLTPSPTHKLRKSKRYTEQIMRKKKLKKATFLVVVHGINGDIVVVYWS